MAGDTLGAKGTLGNLKLYYIIVNNNKQKSNSHNQIKFKNIILYKIRPIVKNNYENKLKVTKRLRLITLNKKNGQIKI
jgi:hypothetical protein